MLITVMFIVNIFEMSFLCCLPNANLSLSTLIMSKLLTQDKDQRVAKSSWYKSTLLQAKYIGSKAYRATRTLVVPSQSKWTPKVGGSWG